MRTPGKADREAQGERDARGDWDARITRRTGQGGTGEGGVHAALVPDLAPPQGVSAFGGVGHVTISWQPVDGAVGYAVHRSAAPDGPFTTVDHRGGDVLSMPSSPYVDTTGEAGRTYWYRVASVPEVTVVGRLGPAVEAAALPASSGPPPTVDVLVDAAAEPVPLARPWQAMIGSERLSQLLSEETTGGRAIGAELLDALTRVHREFGITAVRAHAIFHDDTAVYREVDGRPVHDFTRVDRIYDLVLGAGLSPVVELGFMPTDLARDPDRQVFAYHAVISPPRDYERWGDLVEALTRHLVERYGLSVVLGWDFEVWNEANLEVFWSGTQAEWLHLYDVTVAAVKAVDERLSVGGPSSAAAGWVDDLLAHCAATGTPVDFVSTHTYGSPPLDLRASLERHGYAGLRILWTEWGVSPRHFDPVNDSVFAGVFLIAGMRSAAGRIEALSHWVASDHFQELGHPPRLLHGGFGLLSVGNLPKPRYHALAMLSALGAHQLPVRSTGDGAAGLVDAWASRSDDGDVTVLLWSLSLDQSKAGGDTLLTRRVSLVLTGLAGDQPPEGGWTMCRRTLGVGRGDLAAAATALGVDDWPADDTVWKALEDAAQTPVTESAVHVEAGSTLTVDLELDMPSAVLIQLRPGGR